MVLALHHLHPKAGTLLGHGVQFGHAAGHQPRFTAACSAQRRTAALKDPAQPLARRQLLPARRQCRADGGQFLLGGFGGFGGFGGRQKTGQHKDRRKSVQRPVLAAGVQPAPAVEDALRIGGQGHQGNGVEQGLHKNWR